MARGTVNKVIIIGRLGSDPEVRYSAAGKAIAKFNVATNESVPSGEGNWEERTEWHRIVAFDKQAEFCGNYLSKGKQVYIEGRLRTNQWEDAQGVKRYTTEIVVREVQMLGGTEGSTWQGQTAQRSSTTPSPPSPSGPTLNENLPPLPGPGTPEDDIPF
jgi:single-strand DNA-binding protein